MSDCRDLRGYTFSKFSTELEILQGNHPHVVRRESEVVYRDEFALRILMDTYPIVYEQTLSGWARSFYTLEGHMDAIRLYATPNTPYQAVCIPVYEQAIQAVTNELSSLPVVRAFDVQSELDCIHYEQSSAAGYDYIGPKGESKGINHKRAIKRALATLYSAIRDEEGGPDYAIETAVPDVGYTRTQLTDLTEKTKVRGVWGRAFHYILLEGTSARPLLDEFSKGQTFLHIGEDPQQSVPRILSELSRECRWLYAVDWSSFDSSVSRFEIDTAFQILKTRISFPNIETEQAYELCRLLFIHKKIAAPDGNIYWSHKGIPSGSYYTSLIGSIVNRLRIDYLWRILYNRSPQKCYTQGDDSLIGDDEYLKPESLASEAIKYGWIINPDKTERSRSPEEVTFLGRTCRGLFNHRSLERCLRLLIFPEYPVESGRISAYRAYSINQDSGGMSEIIATIARRLRRQYGVASEEEVPSYFIRYVP